jgi:hypothetical protein
MMRAFDATLLILLAYTVLMLNAEHLLPDDMVGVFFLASLIGFAAIALEFVPSRRPRR